MSPFIPGLFVGFLLGLYAGAILLIVYGAHRKVPPPTMAARKRKTDRVHAEVEGEGVNYQWVNLTGEEQ